MFICLKNGNYFGKKFTFADLQQSKDFLGASEEIKKKKEDRFYFNDFNWDSTVDENEQKIVFNLYCEGEMGTEPPPTTPLP